MNQMKIELSGLTRKSKRPIMPVDCRVPFPFGSENRRKNRIESIVAI